MALRTSKASPRDGVVVGAVGCQDVLAERDAPGVSKALSRAIFRVMIGCEPSPVRRFLPVDCEDLSPDKPEPATGLIPNDEGESVAAVAIATFARFLDGPDEGLGESWWTFACHWSLLL